MKLSDLSHGPNWIVWPVLAILIIISIVLITGHGSWLIAGYNTASKEEKAKYDEKKLCRAAGICMSIISLLVLIMQLFETVLPYYFAYIAVAIIVVDCAALIIWGNFFCKK